MNHSKQVQKKTIKWFTFDRVNTHANSVINMKYCSLVCFFCYSVCLQEQIGCCPGGHNAQMRSCLLPKQRSHLGSKWTVWSSFAGRWRSWLHRMLNWFSKYRYSFHFRHNLLSSMYHTHYLCECHLCIWAIMYLYMGNNVISVYGK